MILTMNARKEAVGLGTFRVAVSARGTAGHPTADLLELCQKHMTRVVDGGRIIDQQNSEDLYNPFAECQCVYEGTK